MSSARQRSRKLRSEVGGMSVSPTAPTDIGVSMTDAIDLDAVTPQDEAIREIMTADGLKGTGWFITLAGSAHPKTQAWATENARRNIRKQAQIEAATVNGRKYKPDDRSVEDARRENVEWIVTRIVDWTPVKIGGQVYNFSDAVAIELLSRPKLNWVFNQIVEWVVDERVFTKASASD